MAGIASASAWQAEGVRLFRPQLLVRSRPKADEHYLGYWLRTADENGLAIPSWLQLVHRDLALPKGVGRARWCSCCLAEHDAYWRAEWDAGWALCFKHRCWLQDTCPGCRRVTRWRAIRHLKCKCGFSFAAAEPMQVSEELAKLLFAPVAQLSTPERWLMLEPEERLRLAEFIGSLQIHGLYGKPLKKVSGTAVATQREAVTTGAAILLAGEAALHELLDQLRCSTGHRATPQLVNDAYPGLLSRMRKCLSLREREYLWTDVLCYLGTTMSTEQPVLWNRKHARFSRSTRDCATKLRVRPGRVKALLQQHGLSPALRQSPNGRTMLAVSSEQLETVQRLMHDWLPHREAARQYGLSSARQKELIKAGWLQSRNGRIQKSSAEKLFGKFSRTALCSGDAPPEGTITLSKALQLYIPLPLTDSFVAAIIAGEVKTFTADTAALHCNAIQVLLSDVVAFDKSDKRSIEHYLSLPEAAVHLSLKQEVLYHLVNQGYLRAVVRRTGRRPARFISREEIEHFTRDNEPLVAAAARAKVGARAAVSWARENGLHLFSGPGIDGGRQYFIRKPPTEA